MTDTGTARGGDGSTVESCVTGIVELKKSSSLLRRAVDLLPRWVTPNMVTIFRGLLFLPIVCLVLSGRFGAALAVFVAAMLLDVVDGTLAEVRNVKTALGAFLDPLADKVLTCGSLLSLAPALPAAIWPVIAAVCLVAAALTVTRLVKAGRHGTKDGSKFAAKTAGKLKCILESVSIGLIMLCLSLGLGPLVWAGGALLLGSVALAALSLRSQLQNA